MIPTVKVTLQLNENNRHTFKKRTKKCKYIWLIKHFYYHILSLSFILTLCMEFCACYAENQIGLNACALKAASNHHSAFLWFSLWAYKRCLQLRCCNLVCSEKRVRSSSVFFLSGPQYSYWHNTEGAVQPPDQEIPQPCFGVCLYRFITQIVSYCNQVFLFCVPKCGGFLWLMAWVLFSYLNPDLQGSPSSGLIQNFKTPADVVSELIFKKSF